MLLTIKQPVHHGYRSIHDYTPPTPPSTSRFSPAVASSGASLPSKPSSNKSLPPLPPARTSTPSMSTPHRGLPPPAAMTLPQLQQQPPPPPLPIGQPPLNQPMGQLPAPPQQWQGAEESMRNWLQAKTEEDKRKQEEEKTRQETLRLEQRKIEQDMLRTSLSGGIPPYMIPMVFAGMGGGNLPNASLEWAQHYMAQAHHLQQHQAQAQQLQHQQSLPSQGHPSPEQPQPHQHQRRDSRAVQHYVPQPQPAPMTLPSTPIGPPTSQAPFQGYPNPLSPRTRARQAAVPSQAAVARQPQTSHLPRLNTGEMHIPPTAPSHPLQQSQSVQQESSQTSPSIYFHHWQPPTTQPSGAASGNQPTTPSDHTSSPKKRKATGPQQPAPPPTSQPQYTSPPFSHSSSVSNTPSRADSRRRGHSRQRSDVSNRGVDAYGRPVSRHRHNESFSMTSPPLNSDPQSQSQQSQSQGGEPRRASGGSHPLSSLLEQPATREQQHQFTGGPVPEMNRSEEEASRRVVSDGRDAGAVVERDEGRD